MGEWCVHTIEELATVSAGNSAPQDKALFQDGQHPFVRTADVGKIRFGTIDSTTDYLNDAGITKLRRFPRGTILFPKSGASTFLNHRVMMAIDGYVASHLATIQVEREKLHPWFLLYFLHTIEAQDLVQDHSYPSLNLPLIKSIRVPLPPLPEQERIVAILDEAFAAIATATTNAEKNLANARELFESELNRVFSRKGDGWKKKALAEFVREIATGPFGSMLHKSDYIEGGIPLINPIHLVGGTIVPDTRKTVSDEVYARLSNYVLHENDIVIARRGEIGRCAVVTNAENGWLCGTGCFVIRPSAETNPHFLCHLLRSRKCRERLESQSGRATMPSLSNKQLASLHVRIPPMSRQKPIVSQIKSIADTTHQFESLYTRKLGHLTELKQSILQKAFTGELTNAEDEG